MEVHRATYLVARSKNGKKSTKGGKAEAAKRASPRDCRDPRMFPEDRSGFEAEAKRNGVSLSDWIRASLKSAIH